MTHQEAWEKFRLAKIELWISVGRAIQQFGADIIRHAESKK
jgi:hypothetical protein